MAVVLVLDIGTSKLCAMAFCTESLQALSIQSAANSSDVPGLKAGRHEQDPLKTLQLCKKLLKDAAADIGDRSEEIAGIGFSGQMHGVLLINAQLQPVTNLITWMDQRAVEHGPGSLNSAVERRDASAPSRAGCELNAGYGGASLFWLKENGRLPQNARAVAIADFVAASLCGTVATDPTHAASWGIMDLTAGTWDEQTVQQLALPGAILPKIHLSGRSIGTIKKAVAAELGIPESVQVCAPVGDNQASVIGAAGFAYDTAIINLGTGGQVSVPRKDYRFVRELEIRPMPLGGYILVGASLCAGWSYAYLNRFFRQAAAELCGAEYSEAEMYEKMNRLAAQAPPDAGGLQANTQFSGSRSNPDQRGSFANITTDNLTMQNMSRAVVEGIVRELADRARKAGIRHLTSIIASGNLARKNPLVLPTIERLFGLPCKSGPAREEASLGAAYCTAVGLGLARPEDLQV